MMDIEKALLGIALSEPRDFDQLAKIVKPSDFYHPAHEKIWRAAVRTHEAGNPVNPMTVRGALVAEDPRRDIDPVTLIDLVGSAPVTAQGEWYATQVTEAAGRRRVVAAGHRLIQFGESETTPLSEVRDRARQEVDKATASDDRSVSVRVADVLPDVIDIAEHGDRSPALPTGWADVDRIITGLAPGRLVVVGARPGVGKSVMGTNLALEFAHRHKHAVLVASIEMPRNEVVQRLVAAHARVNLTGLSTGDVSEAHWSQIRRLYGEIEALPITIEDGAIQSVTSVRAAAREIERERGDLALIVVDYLQLMKPSDSRVNRSEQIGEISRGLKVLARETGACVVAMAQVNREGTKHTDGRPRMTDLRESGAIEADADQVILLHRPSEETPEIEVIVDKNRWGPKGVATLHIQGHYARLAGTTWAPPVRAVK